MAVVIKHYCHFSCLFIYSIHYFLFIILNFVSLDKVSN